MAHSNSLHIPQYEVKKYPKNDLDKVQSLFTQAFGGRELSRQGLQWQMEKNPCLQGRATSLWDHDTLVAYNALTPYPAFLYGTEMISAVSGTTMADEHYLGASLQLLSECEKQNEDIQLIYGFPNRNSFGIMVRRLKHHYVGDVAFWTAPAADIPSGGRIIEFFSFTDEYEAVSRELSKTHSFIKARKKDVLNWRFFQKPGYEYHGFEYEKRGYIVADSYIENGIKQLQIVDLIADSDEVMAKLLLYARKVAAEWNCKFVKLWLTSGNYRETLEDCGYVYGEHPFAMTVWSQDLDLSSSYITMMDSDIF